MSRMRLKKLERTKALKEWRAVGAILSHYTDLSLDDFELPRTCATRRPTDNEQRIKRRDGPVDRAFLMSVDGGEKEVLPIGETPGKWPQLTVSLDSGSTGRAGAGFAKHKLRLFLYVVYDLLHRLIRDAKLALDHCSSVHRAVLHYTFVSSLNFRPFGSGVWHEEKKNVAIYDGHITWEERTLFFSGGTHAFGPRTSTQTRTQTKTI